MMPILCTAQVQSCKLWLFLLLPFLSQLFTVFADSCESEDTANLNMWSTEIQINLAVAVVNLHSSNFWFNKIHFGVMTCHEIPCGCSRAAFWNPYVWSRIHSLWGTELHSSRDTDTQQSTHIFKRYLTKSSSWISISKMYLPWTAQHKIWISITEC